MIIAGTFFFSSQLPRGTVDSLDIEPILDNSENSHQVLINASVVPAPVLFVCDAFCSLYISTPDAKHKSLKFPIGGHSTTNWTRRGGGGGGQPKVHACPPKGGGSLECPCGPKPSYSESISYYCAL
jgi:hypothetical protein